MSDYKYSIIRSKRRTMCLELKKESNLIVRVPFWCSDKDVEKFVSDNERWIDKNLRKREQNKATETQSYKTSITDEEAKHKAKEILPQKVELYSNIMGLHPIGVKITSAKTRFGSCSGKNSICFSHMLMKYPEEAIDYVVVHELAHIKHKNHGPKFYELVEKYIPNYKQIRKTLK